MPEQQQSSTNYWLILVIVILAILIFLLLLSRYSVLKGIFYTIVICGVAYFGYLLLKGKKKNWDMLDIYADFRKVWFANFGVFNLPNPATSTVRVYGDEAFIEDFSRHKIYTYNIRNKTIQGWEHSDQYRKMKELEKQDLIKPMMEDKQKKEKIAEVMRDMGEDIE